jgi:hypothetical protein
MPKELPVVGYDYIEIMQELSVPVTKLRGRSDEVGHRTAAYLIAAIEGATLDLARECGVQIVERASSAEDSVVRRFAGHRYHRHSAANPQSITTLPRSQDRTAIGDPQAAAV